MGNKTEQWMKDAAKDAAKDLLCHSVEYDGRITEEEIEQIICGRFAESVPAPSELERQVREKWDALEDDCDCGEFTTCDNCRTRNRFLTFLHHNALRIAEALVARLPKEEKDGK